MQRIGLSVLLVFATAACDKSDSSNQPEPEPAPVAAEPEPESEPEPEPEPEPAPEPENPEVSDYDVPTYSKDGFEARNLSCEFAEPTREGPGYIDASLRDADAALDACAPKGAAIDVEWAYLGGPTGEIDVAAGSKKQADCVAAALAKIRAGVTATCKATLLLGDTAAATAAFDAR
jgi:hypothetical protein